MARLTEMADVILPSHDDCVLDWGSLPDRGPAPRRAAVASMDLVDGQIHVWEDDRPERPWDPKWKETLHWMLGFRAVTADTAVAAMDVVGVGVVAAVVVSFSCTRTSTTPSRPRRANPTASGP